MQKPTLPVAAILLAMLILMLGSIRNDSAIMDELAHIPAGYGYVTELDYRLNPEHPPLAKTWAGLSARLFANPRFPTDTKFWREDLNGQWDQGRAFLYESGNDADSIIFWSRLPLILLAIFFAWFLWGWVKARFGGAVAFLTLFLFAFSPTFIAHARYVTTDLAAAFGFFIGLVTFLQFLEIPSRRHIIIAGLALGTALLLKFSTVLLIPIYIILLISRALVRPRLHGHERLRFFSRLLGQTALVGLAGLILVWAVYIPHVWNYPQEKQLRDARILLSSYGFRPAVDFNLSLINNKFTRPFGQYLLGVLMVNQRAAGGNTAYFLGDVTNAGSRLYFPLLYVVKETLALHILTLIAIWFAIWKVGKRSKLNFGEKKLSLERTRLWIHDHFTEFASLIFITFYWGVTVQSPLNIGVRHVLPTFPFIYLLVSRQIAEWLRWHEVSAPRTWREWLKNIYQLYAQAIKKYVLVGALLLWITISVISTFPHFLSYYNFLGGETPDGWRIAADSNYDWGQDLKRLAEYVEENNIKKISVDYFGGGNPRYYLGNTFEPWWSARGPAFGWFAVSATSRQGAFGTPVKGWVTSPEDSYEWLKPYEPVARAGQSIFIYKLP